jgi:hypothetical protein
VVKRQAARLLQEMEPTQVWAFADVVSSQWGALDSGRLAP